MSRTNRFRRWLAYKLLPGTTEYSVALARQKALQELRYDIQRGAGSPDRLRSHVRAYCDLRDNVPVREQWDNSVQSPGEGDV